MKEAITKNGGKVTTAFGDAPTYLVSTEDNVTGFTIKTAQAAAKGIAVIKEEFFLDSVEKGSLLDPAPYLLKPTTGGQHTAQAEDIKEEPEKTQAIDVEQNLPNSKECQQKPASVSRRTRSRIKKEVEEKEEEPNEVAPPKKKAKVQRKSNKRAPAKKEEEEEEEVVKPLQQPDSDDEPEQKVKVLLKGRAPVDPNFTASSSVHVYEDGDDVYDCMLNQVNISTNNNKFYQIQLLEEESANGYFTFNRWGRVGETGQYKTTHFPSLIAAKGDFLKKFYDKTGNSWDDRKNFVKKAGKYMLMEMDYGTDNLKEEVKKVKAEKKKAEPQKKKECTLDPKVQDLLRLIFDMKMMEHVMAEMEYDVKKNPLGKLKKEQIMRGYKILGEIDAELKGSGRPSVLQELSSQFYTLIPHSFPRSIKPPVIASSEVLRKKLAMVEALGNIEIAASIISADDPADDDASELDKNYKRLKTSITVVDPKSEEFAAIQKYVKNGHPRNTPKIVAVYKLDRDGEEQRFSTVSSIGNRKLLWHGSGLANFVGILSQGLRIAPPEAPASGYRFGKGIYFADLCQLSAGYCRAYNRPDFLMLLCDVALGKMAKFSHDKYVEKAPKGSNSVLALGRIEPDPKDVGELGGAQVPFGKIVDTSNKNVSCHEHQYIVYDVAQARQRYLIHFHK